MNPQDTIDQYSVQGPATGDGTRAGGSSLAGSTGIQGPQEQLTTPTVAPSPAGAPLATAPTDPRIGQLAAAKTQLQTIQESLNAGLDSPAELAVGGFQGEQDPFDTERQQTLARRAQLALHQTEIDATNQIYDEQLNQARLQGEGRLGSTRAIGARGGILGSDFASSQKQEQITANNAQQRAIQAERQAKLGSIMGEVRSAVFEDMEDRRQAYAMGADQVLNYISGEGTRKEKNVNKFAQAALAQGIDISEMDEEELKEIAGKAGVTVADLTAGYYAAQKAAAAENAESDLKARKTEAEISKIEAGIEQGKLKTIGEGTMLYNTETGEMFKNPKTYKADSASGISIGEGTLSQEAIAGVHETLNATRGQKYQNADGEWITPPPEDKYANTQTYMDEFNGFVALGGDPKDFIEEYDPDIYINPQDETRSFLKSHMKKTAADTITDIEEFQQKIDAVQALKEGT